MLTPEQMTKLRIFCPNSQLKPVIEELYRAQVLDVVQHTPEEGIDISNPLEESETVSEAVVKARGLKYKLHINDKDVKEPDVSLEEAIQKIRDLDERVSDLQDRKKEIEEETQTAREHLHKLSLLKRLGIGLDLYQDSRYLTHYVGYVTDAPALKKELKKQLKSGYELASTALEEQYLIALFVEKSQEAEAAELVKRYGFSQLKIPAQLQEETKESLQEKISALSREQRSISKKMRELGSDHGTEILGLEQMLERHSHKAEAPLMFGKTNNVTMITGWVPQKQKKKLFRNLRSITDNQIYIEEQKPTEEEEIPVKANNPMPMQPYEFLLRLFSFPSYREIDPTLFIFFTFPLFFGFMLGDIGYGLTTGAIFLLLRRKMPQLRSMFNIMLYCSAATIVFGLIYGEFFGFLMSEWHFVEQLTHQLHIHYPLLHRGADSVMELLIISVGVGAVHVNLGLIFGFINVFKNHGFVHALLEKGSWVVLEAGVALIALSAMGVITAPMYVGGAVALIGVAMLAKGEGLEGVVEIPTLFVHMGSYMRLMAIGLASVSLAMVVNQQSAPLITGSPALMIGGILIFALGHTINIALGIIGPFLHSLRLHYVEHFTKFYKGGGREYQPFGLEKNQTA